MKSFREIQGLISAGEAPAAEAAAREWLTRRGSDPAVLGNVGGVLIDLGNDRGDQQLVEEGVGLTRQALAAVSTTEFKFNLANGLVALSPAAPDDAVAVRFDPRMAEIVELYYEAIDESDRGVPEPRFNLVTALMSAGRAVEAVDLARETLAEHPEHGKGWASLGDALWAVWFYYGRYPDLLQDAVGAYRLALKFEAADQPFRTHVEENVSRALALLAEESTQPHPELAGAVREPASLLLATNVAWDESLQSFIWTADLGLNLCSGCRAGRSNAYDRFPLKGVLVAPARVEEAAVKVAEINVLLQGFIGARALLWLSRASYGGQVEVLSWPVTGLSFSRRTAFLAAAFREAYGVLDRLAALLNERFKIGDELYFDKLFFDKRDKKLVFRAATPWPDSVGFRALLYLSASFEKDNGRFRGLRSLRNSLQHSLVMPGRFDPTKASPWQEVTVDELESETTRMLRLTRAAILYCCEGLRVIEANSLREAQQRGETIRPHPEGNIRRE